MDTERQSFGLKEHFLALTFIKLLGISGNSSDAQSLAKWKVQSSYFIFYFIHNRKDPEYQSNSDAVHLLNHSLTLSIHVSSRVHFQILYTELLRNVPQFLKVRDH